VAVSAKNPNPDSSGESEDRYRPGYELVAERLLQFIAEQNLKPGDRLPTEQGLAETLDATRNVTREAVKVLAAIGRLSVRKGAGIFVASSGSALADEELVHFQPTDMEHVVMLLDYRRLIETETARRAATLATPVQVRVIREAAEASAAAGAANHPQQFATTDAQFHHAISIAANNVFLQSGVTNVRKFAGQIDVLLFHGDVPGSLADAGRQHVAIAAAIAEGDTDLAARLMSEHIDTTQRQFERKIRDRLLTLTRRG
jgi:DNA-binding FadR family transcriptional regulator